MTAEPSDAVDDAIDGILAGLARRPPPAIFGITLVAASFGLPAGISLAFSATAAPDFGALIAVQHADGHLDVYQFLGREFGVIAVEDRLGVRHRFAPEAIVGAAIGTIVDGTLRFGGHLPEVPHG